MATWTMKYGDSLWLDITPVESIDSIDSTWPNNWSGTWKVKEKVTDTDAIESGDLILFDGLNGRDNIAGKFRLIIEPTPDDATPIPVGEYKLCIEIYNSNAKFRKEIAHDKLKIIAGGV